LRPIHRLKFSFLLLILFSAQPVIADTVVLIHGYLSNAQVWQTSGVNQQLNQAGWQHKGHLSFSYDGLFKEEFTTKITDKQYYTANLPYKASANNQADWLQAMLVEITARNPESKITLVGHSAGGVIARLAIVRHGIGNVHRLITIAAPHLGTGRASEALNATQSRGLLGKVKEWVVREKIGDEMYDTVKQSRGILIDLLPPQPGNMLFWLNWQPHPDIKYISIVRANGYRTRDMAVPSFSQDMNRIPALLNKSDLIISDQGHQLSYNDGILLIEIL